MLRYVLIKPGQVVSPVCLKIKRSVFNFNAYGLSQSACPNVSSFSDSFPRLTEQCAICTVYCCQAARPSFAASTVTRESE